MERPLVAETPEQRAQARLERVLSAPRDAVRGAGGQPEPEHQGSSGGGGAGGSHATADAEAAMEAELAAARAADVVEEGAPVVAMGVSKAFLKQAYEQWLSEPCEIVTALRDVPAEREGALPLVQGHVITVLSKAAGEVFHAVVDGKFTIVDVVIPEG